MNLTPQAFLTNRQRYLPMLNRLETLLSEMDRAYAAVADQYGFVCRGCLDNCCLTRFFHHTLGEYLYLVEGMRSLTADDRQMVRKQARAVNAKMAEADRRGKPLRMMCPLNRDDRCMLYPFRPMICRLHGIPHELHRPGGGIVKNPGCDNFLEQCRASGTSDYIPFDRTPFYRQMAMLEKELRLETGYRGKIKLSIAQMLLTITDSAHEID
jgi:Fe-S-cluster containining protein